MLSQSLEEQDDMAQQTYQIGNLDCPNCAKELETGVQRLSGVSFARVDFNNGRLILEGAVSDAALRQRVEAFGSTLITPDEAEQAGAAAPARGGVRGFWDYLLSTQETRMALMGAATIALALIAGGIGLDPFIQNMLYTVALSIALWPVARSGINTLRINRQFSINLLMSIAGVGALLIGEYLEAATMIFLFSIGEALEGYVTQRARGSIKSLLDLKPKEAVLLRDGKQHIVSVEALAIEDLILVKPGEAVPMDGVVEAGTSSVNQAPITGESLPVDKTAGDAVYAGSLNHNGALQVRVTRRAEDNTLNRIIQMVEEAQGVRAPSQRMIDQFANVYTPAVVMLATLVALVPPLVFGAPFVGATPEEGWLYRALTMLVVACPCALVISTPVTVISAITRAARQGVLIKGGKTLEALGLVKAIAFDKTGTLTHGKPVVTQVRTTACDDAGAACAPCDDLLALAAAVEQHSNHPLAKAIVNEAQQRNIADRYAASPQVETLSGAGIRGEVDGQSVVIGSHAYFDQHFDHVDDICHSARAAEANGQTTMLVHDGRQVRGFIAVADAVRADSAEVVAHLNAAHVATIMLTGDHPIAAQAVGKAVGVTDVRASLLPQDKVSAVQSLAAQYGTVAMVGDGINDTPALAAAQVGVAMGGMGSAQAMETADVVLMQDHLHQLPQTLRLAQFARRLILQNVGLSIGMKLLFLAMAATGGITMWAAIFADVGMSLIVTLNGMRPLRRETF